MPSPFPGMDPYLEGPLWPDVHQALAAEIRRRLAAQIRPRYVARLATRFVADLRGIGPARILYPDVDVTVARPAHEPVTTYEPPVELAPPLVTPPLVLTQPEPPRIKLVTVEIRDAQEGRLVTSIEILSPINKRGDGLVEYQNKRWLVMDSPAHLLELDLLRRGHRPVSFERVEEKDRPLVEQASYFAFLTRSGSGRKVETWPLKIRDQLPVLPVPLLAPDPDAGLDLEAAMQAIYDEAAYDLSIDYQEPPDPPLAGDDAEWADALRHEQGLR
jgi:hypothetical protein